MQEPDKLKQVIDATAVDHQGSLGLLALGDIGLALWREKKAKHLAELTKEKEEGNIR